jgi:hypothetical protein
MHAAEIHNRNTIGNGIDSRLEGLFSQNVVLEP